MRILKLIKLLFFICLFSSCASLDNGRQQSTTYKNSRDIISSTSVKNLKINKDIKLYKNKYIEKWIKYFSEKDRERFQKFLQNGFYYKEVIQTTLAEDDLPFLLYYLPLIESGFNTVAHSSAGAVGPWQFIQGTAKRYGLGVNHFIDERRDPILSTEAAVKYLRDLFNVFHSWELALAAYNCGELRVLRAIMKGKTRDFWELVDKKLLPRETREYVPKFLAAAYVGENSVEYNFQINMNNSFPDVELVDIPGGVSLLKLSKLIGEDFKTLVILNQSLKKKMTPSWVKDHPIWIKPKFTKKVKAFYSRLAKSRQWGKSQHFPSHYMVRRGDNLTTIARKFKVSVKRLKRLNNISRSKIFIGQKLWLSSKKYKRVKGEKFYFAKRNDSLSRIAGKYKLSVKYLKKLNGLHHSRIYVGQKLDVSKGVGRFKYIVKYGDSLNRIARLYRISVRTLKRKNSLKSSKIYKGQILNI